MLGLVVRYCLLWLFAPQADVDELASAQGARCGHPLTAERARVHLAASRAAGWWHHVDDDLLRRIAWHESCFEVGAVTPEPTATSVDCGGAMPVSCGVGTPVPQCGCRGETTSALAGYLAEARHLVMWMRAYGARGALHAYAGGGALARLCARTSDARCDVADALSLGWDYRVARRTSLW